MDPPATGEVRANITDSSAQSARSATLGPPAASRMSEVAGVATAGDGGGLAWRLSAECPGLGPANPRRELRQPLLVVVNGLANDDTQWRAYLDEWKGSHPFLYWDYRGHGLSPPGPNPTSTTMSSQASDLAVVMKTALEEASISLASGVVLMAYSLGVQVAMEFLCSQHHRPELIAVQGVVAIEGTSGRVIDAVVGRGWVSSAAEAAIASLPAALLQVLSRLPALVPSVAYWVMVTTGLGEASVPFDTAVSWGRHLSTMDVSSARAFVLAAQRHSLSRESLQQVEAPVLVLTAGRDLFAPPCHSELLLSALPNVQHIHMEVASHMGLAGHWAVIHLAIRQFLRKLQAGGHAKA